MEHNGWDHGLKVTADGTGLVGHGGGVLLRKLADQCGLTAALEAALARPGTFPQLSRGMVIVSMAIAIALGATSMSDIAVLAQCWAPRPAAPPSGAPWAWPTPGRWRGSRRPGRGSARTCGS